MGRIYRIQTPIAGMTLTTAKTLLYVAAGAAKPLFCCEAHVTNADNDTNEQWQIRFDRVTTIGTPGGGAPVVQKNNASDTAHGMTLYSLLTTDPTTWADTPIDERGVPSLGGWHFEPNREDRPFLGPSLAWGIRSILTIASTTIYASMVVEELG